MDKLERVIQQRIHFHKAMAELYAILEYYITHDERKAYEEMCEIIDTFKTRMEKNSPIA